MDKAPQEVYATLLDRGEYLCSARTMYRLLAANQEVRERRDQLHHPSYAKPELLATAPNQVWSWDITKLLGPVKWSYFYLYVILDIFSRYVVGWMVASHEANALAQKLIQDTMEKQNIQPGQLTLHADRGPSMKSQPVALLLADMGVTKTHSRPHVSDDNPYSEAQFKTLKYRPDFPERFGSLEDARAFSQSFFTWYNAEHYHSGSASDAAGRSLRLGGTNVPSQTKSPSRRLRSSSGEVCPKSSDATGASYGGMDQPAETGKNGGLATLNSSNQCLIFIDTFRYETAGTRRSQNA
jgi:transposase InsO family protein